MCPFFIFYSHPFFVPRKVRQLEHSCAFCWTVSQGQAAGLRWAHSTLWDASAKCPPNAHQFTFSRRCWTLPFLQTPTAPDSFSFILYLLRDEPELLFGPATPLVGDQPSLHIYWAFDFLSECPFQILYSCRIWAEAMRGKASGWRINCNEKNLCEPEGIPRGNP